MKILNYTLVLSVVAGMFGTTFGIKEINYMKEINDKNGQSLYDFVQEIGYKTFGGSQGLKNLLSDIPEISDLTEDTLVHWKYLLLNFKSWLQLSKFTTIKGSAYERDVDYLLEVSDIDIIGVYSKTIKLPATKELTKTLITPNLLRVTRIYQDTYKQLVTLVKKFPHKNGQDAINDYKKVSNNKSFDLNSFFRDYMTVFKANANKTKERNVVIVLTASGVLNGNESYEEQVEKVTLLLNLLEELINQSNNSGLFSKSFLTKEQTRLAQTIVNDLYSLYPASNTHTVASIIKLATSKTIKPVLFLWTAARVLLVTLQAYLRKLESLQK